jgi:hypothetical protein
LECFRSSNTKQGILHTGESRECGKREHRVRHEQRGAEMKRSSVSQMLPQLPLHAAAASR